jgi:hypothetical protein
MSAVAWVICNHSFDNVDDVEARKGACSLPAMGLGTGDWGLGTGDWGLTHEARGLDRDYHWNVRVLSLQVHWNRP